MLARSFKTAEELGLTEKNHNALISVLYMLERGEVPAHLFSMTSICVPQGVKTGRWCGSAGCIRGWAYAMGAEQDFPVKTGIHSLFYPFHVPGAWKATPAQAAIALANYLTSGHDAWQEAMHPTE